MTETTAPTTTISIPRQLGQVIRAKRTQAGLTQQQLADRANVSRTFIVRLEAGTATSLYPQKLLDVLKVLNLHMKIIDNGPIPDEFVADETVSGETVRKASTSTSIDEYTKRYSFDPTLFEPRAPRSKVPEKREHPFFSDSNNSK